MHYLRGTCGITRMDGGGNENVNRRLSMSNRGEGIICAIVMVKHSNLRWFAHLERMGESEMTREMWKSGIDAGNGRG